MGAIGKALAVEDSVEVAGVRFATLRAPEGSTDNWWEMDIELEARPIADRTGRLTPPIRVEALLGYERPIAGGERRWEFFRSSVELVGLGAGRWHVRFYLPPEIVRRDGLAGGPKFWEVALAGEGMVTGRSSSGMAPALADEIVRRSFREKIAAEGPINDGVLQPQSMTPFWLAYPRATSTSVRRDAWK